MQKLFQKGLNFFDLYWSRFLSGILIIVALAALIYVVTLLLGYANSPGPSGTVLVTMSNDGLPHTYHMVTRLCLNDISSEYFDHCGLSPDLSSVDITISTIDGPVTWHTDAYGAIDFGTISYMGKPELQISDIPACPEPKTVPYYWQNLDELYIELVTTCE